MVKLLSGEVEDSLLVLPVVPRSCCVSSVERSGNHGWMDGTVVAIDSNDTVVDAVS